MYTTKRNIKLFCFPYAGGAASVFNAWRPLMPPFISLRPFELAGRGKRVMERLSRSMDELTDDVLDGIGDELAAGPYALFGHSMGSTIAYALTLKIRDQQLPPPAHVFLSGRGAPHVPRTGKLFHALPDDEFKQNILRLGGVAEGLFDYPEMVRIFLPILRNDLRLSETYTVSGQAALREDITVLFGKDEDWTPEQMTGWTHLTDRPCRMHFFNGGHFFINHHVPEIIEIVRQTLLPWQVPAGAPAADRHGVPGATIN